MRSNCSFAIVSAMVLSLAACNNDKSDALAEVGGEKILKEDLELEMRRSQGVENTRDHAMQRLIERKRMVAEARSSGLAAEAETRRALDNVLIQRLQEKRLQPQIDAIAVSEDDIAARFEAQREKWTRPGTLTIAALFLPSNPADTQRREMNRTQLESIAPEVHDIEIGQGFGSLAVSNSQHQESRFRGGILPPFQDGDIHEGWRETLHEACKSLEPGALSPIIETPDGLCRARVIERQPARQMNLEEARETLRRELLREAEERTRGDFAKSLEKSHPATRRQSLIDAIPEPTPIPWPSQSLPESP